MFFTRKFVAGVLAFLNLGLFSLGLATQAAGPAPIILALDNQTANSYALVTCRPEDGLNVRPLYADYANLSLSRRQYLPAKTAVSPNTKDTYYVHVGTDVLTVHLVNLGFALSGTDADCALPSAFSGNFPVARDNTLNLVLQEELRVDQTGVPGSLRVRNYFSEAFILVLCDAHTGGSIVRTQTIRAKETKDYALTQNSAVYVVPDAVTLQGNDCAQVPAQAYQVLYYNHRPETVTTRTIAGFQVTQPVPEVEESLLTQEISVTTPSGRSLEIAKDKVEIKTSQKQITGEITTTTPDPAQPMLIRTGGFDN